MRYELTPGRIERMLHFFNHASEGMIFHLNGVITDVNPAMLEIGGYSGNELLGSSVLQWIPPEYHPLLKQKMSSRSRHGYEITIYHKSGEEVPVYIKPMDILVEGRSERLLTVQEIRDLTEERHARRKLEAQLHCLNNADPLTNLPTRVQFKQLLDDMCQLHRVEEHLFAVVHIAIERMTLVNDIFGRDAGDQLVKQWVKRLRQQLRRFSSHTVARIAGNRFAVALPYMENHRTVFRMVENLRAVLDAPYDIDQHEITNISSSYGIVFYPEHGEDAERLMSRAEVASRYARQGSDTIRTFSSKMDIPSLDILKLENRLKGALERDEMHLYYQPKVDVKTQSVVGFEALIRWQDSESEMISPAEFIPIAEQSGGIVPIGEWVIWNACEHLATMQRKPGPTPKVSVNISGLQFRHPNLVEIVTQGLALFEVDPAYLDLELTESVVMSDVEASIKTLGSLKEQGVSISIDDFGTGYSSLSYLKRFPIDTLKIDRSFITDITSNPQDESITVAIIALAKSLGLETVAEGVETQEQFMMLKKMGCDTIQGFLFGKPLSAEEALALI